MISNKLFIVDSTCFSAIQCPRFAFLVKTNSKAICEVLGFAGLS